MGLILGILKEREAESVFIDLENAVPTNREMEVYNLVDKVLARGQEVLRLLEEYKGCAELTRKAMSSPSVETETAAFEGLLMAVDSIATFFDFSKQLERALSELLLTLAQPAEAEVKQSLADQQALARQLALIFDFALQFDALRMARPNLCNDFSYYRRLLPKFARRPDIKVKDDEASGMVLFTAEHIPMMTSLARGSASALQRNEHVTTALSVMANSCLKMIRGKKFENAATNLFCARAMTGAIVLFDHTDLQGVFHKKSPISIKQAILCLKKDFPNEQSLLNAIHYSTKTFRSAPSSVQELFD